MASASAATYPIETSYGKEPNAHRPLEAPGLLGSVLRQVQRCCPSCVPKMLTRRVRRVGRYVLKASRPVWSANYTLAKRSRLLKPLVVHVAQRGWVLDEVRKAISRPLGKHYRFMPPFMARHLWPEVRNSIVHFGTSEGFTRHSQYLRIHPSNRQVLTWTHGQRSNPDPGFALVLDKVGAASRHTDKIVAISRVGQDILISEGVDRNKIAHIPLGIDSQLFTPPTALQRAALRRQLGIPGDSFCIGSFQKDGEGWGEGMTPKWVKGPEVFLQVIDRLRKSYQLFVLLTGPSRGFVKAGLERMGVPYRHVWLNITLTLQSTIGFGLVRHRLERRGRPYGCSRVYGQWRAACFNEGGNER